MLVNKTTLDVKAISQEVTSRVDAHIKIVMGDLSIVADHGDFDADDISNIVLDITADVMKEINSGELK